MLHTIKAKYLGVEPGVQPEPGKGDGESTDFLICEWVLQQIWPDQPGIPVAIKEGNQSQILCRPSREESA